MTRITRAVMDALAHDGNEKQAKTDADFLMRELTHIEKTIIKTEYPERAFASGQVIPIDTALPEGMEFGTYKVWNKTGVAKIIANRASDLPKVGLDYKEVLYKIRTIGDSYDFSTQDIRAAKMAGRSLDSEKGLIAQEAAMLEWNDSLAFGSVEFNFTGFLNNVNIGEYAITATGSGSDARLWFESGVATKTPAQIIADVNGILNAMVKTTRKVYRPNRCWMDTDHLTYIKTTPYNAGVSKDTIFDFLQNAHKGVVFSDLIELEGDVLREEGILDVDGTALVGSMMVAAKMDPTTAKAGLPMSFKQHAAQPKGLAIEVPCEMRFGPCEIRKPLAFLYGKGI